jgi:alpha-tubulin suppressor-like RCC1 family protein
MLSLSSSRKAPFRKRKSVSPEETQEYIQQENILGYPIDISSIEVSCARTYCAAVTANNTVIIWGKDSLNESIFERIPANLKNIQQIAAGDDWIVALKKDGSLTSWGNRGSEELRAPNLKNVVKVVACRNNFLALLNDGTIRGWGVAKKFDINEDIPPSISENSIEDISVGFNHAVALTSKGRVIIWGDEIGVKFPEIETKVVSIKTFGNFNLALQDNGKLLAWGNTEFGQDLIPKELNEENVISYSVGACHCAAITESGKFYTWGWNVSPTQNFSEVIFEYVRGKIRKEIVDVDVEEKKYFISAPEDAFKVQDEFPVKVFCGYDVTFVVMNSGDVIGWGDKKYDLLDVPEVVPALQRLNQPNIDLRPFGINLNIDNVIYNDYNPDMSLVKPLRETADAWITSSGTYKKGRFLGKGTYGTAYIATKDGVTMAVKSINLFRDDSSKRFRPDILEGNIQEVAVQLIIQEENKRLNPGFRVCGEIYEIAVDPIKKQFYIFQEKLDLPFDDYVEKMRPSNIMFADLMIQMAEKLNWMYDNLEYNHRDFKDDNAMVKFTGSKESSPEFLLIDFGFSCLTYRGVRIKVKTGYFGETEKCFLETRDITFMLFTVYKHAMRKRSLSPEMLKTLRSMLIFKVKGKTCNVADQNCPFERNISEEQWQHDLYDILNIDYVYNPNATTDKLIEKMAPYLEESY